MAGRGRVVFHSESEPRASLPLWCLRQFWGHCISERGRRLGPSRTVWAGWPRAVQQKGQPTGGGDIRAQLLPHVYAGAET